LLPLPQGMVAPRLLTARVIAVRTPPRRGVRRLRGAVAFAPILVSALVLAGDSSTIAQGALLLFAYSLGLAVPFVLAGVVFAPAMGSFAGFATASTTSRSPAGSSS